MKSIKELKKELKVEAKNLRALKAEIVKGQKSRDYKVGNLQCQLPMDKQNYRHRHIAYCELIGRSRDEIEKPKKGNEPSEFAIEKVKSQYSFEELVAHE